MEHTLDIFFGTVMTDSNTRSYHCHSEGSLRFQARLSHTEVTGTDPLHRSGLEKPPYFLERARGQSTGNKVAFLVWNGLFHSGEIRSAILFNIGCYLCGRAIRLDIALM